MQLSFAGPGSKTANKGALRCGVGVECRNLTAALWPDMWWPNMWQAPLRSMELEQTGQV